MKCLEIERITLTQDNKFCKIPDRLTLIMFSREVPSMQALRTIEQVNDHSLTIDLPEFFWKKRVEVIVFPIDDNEKQGKAVRRKPSPLLAATRITGDIIAPAVLPEEWVALK